MQEVLSNAISIFHPTGTCISIPFIIDSTKVLTPLFNCIDRLEGDANTEEILNVNTSNEGPTETVHDEEVKSSDIENNINASQSQTIELPTSNSPNHKQDELPVVLEEEDKEAEDPSCSHSMEEEKEEEVSKEQHVEECEFNSPFSPKEEKHKMTAEKVDAIDISIQEPCEVDTIIEENEVVVNSVKEEHPLEEQEQEKEVVHVEEEKKVEEEVEQEVEQDEDPEEHEIEIERSSSSDDGYSDQEEYAK